MRIYTMTFTKLLASTLCLLSLTLSACGSLPTPNLPPAEQPGSDQLLVKLQSDQECFDTSQKMYEVQADGSFSFLASETPAKPIFVTRQLSAADLQALKTLLANQNLAEKIKSSTAVPEDAPQTADCRSIEVLTVPQAGKAANYDLNGRKYMHSEAYRQAWQAIRQQLDTLANKYRPAQTQPPASLPLKVEGVGECDMGNQMQYEVSASGAFSYTDEAGQQQSRQLSQSEQESLQQVLQATGLPQHFMDSEAIPADAPQTEECRTVQQMSLQVGNQMQTFDLNGRSHRHTEAYRQAFQQILAQLAQLKQPAAGKQSYGLPLQVALDGECGLPDFVRYQLDADGTLTWAEADWPTLTAGNPPTQSRQLSAAEQAEVENFLNAQQLLAASQQSEAIPADAPQTKECRTVTVYTLQVAGQNQSFEGQGTRKFRHSAELLAQLEALQNLLQRLSKK